MRLNSFPIWMLMVVALLGGSRARGDDTLRAALEAKLQAMGCPGALVAVYRDDGPHDCYVLGEADVKTKTPMQREFHMRIGSVTKSFVGNLALQLVDEGKLSLDDPISKYVDDVPNGENITIRQLGNNTSGLFNPIEARAFQSAIIDEPHREWEAREVLKFAFDNDPYDEPGAGWHYSNTNAMLLGLAIEKIEGKSLEEVLQERICKPLGLTGVGFSVDGVPREPYPAAYRYGGYWKWLSYGSTHYIVTDYSASWSGAAGNMYATVDDLAKAMRSIATGAALRDAGKAALTDWVETGIDDMKYGFCLTNVDGWLGHNGDVPGYQAVARYHPELKTTVVVLTNLSNNKDGTMPAEELDKIVRAAIEAEAAATETP